jgi:hypothetical protein
MRIDCANGDGESTNFSIRVNTNNTHSCYIRDFLAPGPDSSIALAHKDFKAKLIDHFRTAREQKYKHKQTKSVIRGQVKMVKHTDEKKQERLDETQVEILLKEWTFQKAKKTFYGGDTVRNPWSPKITKTMFWM